MASATDLSRYRFSGEEDNGITGSQLLPREIYYKTGYFNFPPKEDLTFPKTEYINSIQLMLSVSVFNLFELATARLSS